MNLPEAEPRICFHLALKLALLHRDGHVIHELDPGNFLQLILHAAPLDPCLLRRTRRAHPHSSSTRTSGSIFTGSPGATCTLFTVPARGAVTFVSIFIASSTRISSPASTACPGLHVHLDHQPHHRAAAHFSFAVPCAAVALRVRPPARRPHAARMGRRVARRRALLVFQNFYFNLVSLSVNRDLKLQRAASFLKASCRAHPLGRRLCEVCTITRPCCAHAPALSCSAGTNVRRANARLLAQVTPSPRRSAPP